MVNWEKILQELQQDKTKSLADYHELSKEEKELIEELVKNQVIDDALHLIRSSHVDLEWNNLKQKLPIAKEAPSLSAKPVRLSRSLLKYAALLAVPFLVVSVYLYLNNSPYFSTPISEYSSITQNHDKAILVLADGSEVELDKLSVKNTELSFRIGENKTVDYSSTPHLPDNRFNTLITPKGSEYNLLLSDGSKIHLNSNSRLKFPVNFNGQSTREVFLEKGEAFFEVSKNTDLPFIVNVQGMDVTVLGTSFNINTYNKAIYTTLVEGRLKVSSSINSVIINPNQQVVMNMSNGQLQVKEVDVSSYVGWHHNQLVFDGASLDDIMNTLTNWYDYDVIFVDKAVKDLQFSANLHRYSKIEEVLSLLEKTEKIYFTIKGKRIFIHKKPNSSKP